MKGGAVVGSATPLLCEAAGWEANRTVAAAFSGNQLLLFRADGTSRTVHTFSLPEVSPPGHRSERIRTDAQGITATAGVTDGELGSKMVGQTARLRPTGELVWLLDGVAHGASDAGMGALVDGVPKLVRADGGMSDVPMDYEFLDFLGDPDAEGWLPVRWSVYVNGQHVERQGRVNLDGVRHDQRAIASTPGSNAETWHLEGNGGASTALVNAATNERIALNLDAIAPLRPLEGDFCNQPAVLADGRVGLGLRDGEGAGFYVGYPDGRGWELVGTRLRDVTAIAPERVGDTWVLRATNGYNTYCPPFEPFAPGGGLPGDSLQIVAPGRESFVFAGAPFWELDYAKLDATGTCAYVQGPTSAPESRFVDLSAGVVTETPPFASFTWL